MQAQLRNRHIDSSQDGSPIPSSMDSYSRRTIFLKIAQTEEPDHPEGKKRREERKRRKRKRKRITLAFIAMKSE